MKIINNDNKRKYITPEVAIIKLDNEISMALESEPPVGPGEGPGAYAPEYMKQNPFKQVEGYKFTLKDNILNNLKNCFFCEAVAFPHVDYSFDSKLIDSNTS